MFDPSLLDLVKFDPSNSAVIQYITNTKSKWSNGKYWLGGQIQLSPDDKITNILITNVNKKINDTDDYACNSFELASIRHAKSNFEQIQILVRQYREDVKKRLINDLNKTKLNQDVNTLIVSLCE
jgi:hypothetical protein